MTWSPVGRAGPELPQIPNTRADGDEGDGPRQEKGLASGFSEQRLLEGDLRMLHGLAGRGCPLERVWASQSLGLRHLGWL